MPIFTKDSLETLRQRVDLVDVLTGHIDLKKSGASYKALCPFHDEKTPSLMIQKGDTHYHCFGCGAHGDAIQFLMTHLKISFLDAVENLAARFNVPLQQVEKTEEKQGPNKALLKEALDKASRFYHFYLLHTPEGQEALQYLYSRGIDLDFIRLFQVGLAPRSPNIFRRMMHGLYTKDEVMLEAGLLAERSTGGGYRDFFSDRITFPIRDPHGAIIGFSARKYRTETYGGKYVNSSETSLFKKSRVLFGLNYCRRRIAKERQAVIVEGQIDALRLIQAGFNIVVAGQGTAFGEGHLRELMQLGIQRLYIAPDADEAGLEAACKVGNLFQREGVEVLVLELPPGSDPDAFLCERGAEAFEKLMQRALPYLDFLVKRRSAGYSLESPVAKSQLVSQLAQQIRSWNSPLQVHESLRRLAHLIQVPESVLGIGQEHVPNIYIRKSATVGNADVDPDKVLEFDFLRWLLLFGEGRSEFFRAATEHIKVEDLNSPMCRQIYQTLCGLMKDNKPLDLLSLASELDDSDCQKALSEILDRKVNKERAKSQFIETLQRILDRNWMELREAIKIKIQSGNCSDDEAMDLVRQFDELRRQPPKVNCENL
jgi:DNA primase